MAAVYNSENTFGVVRFLLNEMCNRYRAYFVLLKQADDSNGCWRSRQIDSEKASIKSSSSCTFSCKPKHASRCHVKAATQDRKSLNFKLPRK